METMKHIYVCIDDDGVIWGYGNTPEDAEIMASSEYLDHDPQATEEEGRTMDDLHVREADDALTYRICEIGSLPPHVDVNDNDLATLT